MSAMQHLDSTLSPAQQCHFRVSLANMLSALGLKNVQALETSICEAASERLYREYLQGIPCIFSEEDLRLRTTANKYGLEAPSKRLTENRRSSFRSICKAVTGMDTELPVNSSTCKWVHNIEKCCEALCTIYTTQGSYSHGCTMFLQCLR